MITNFEYITRELSPEEKNILPLLIEGFRKVTLIAPVKAPDIIDMINKKKQKYGIEKRFTQVRLRKLINFIRSKVILPIIGTSKGYYVSYDRIQIKRQIKSLRERADAINSSADGLFGILNEVK